MTGSDDQLVPQPGLTTEAEPDAARTEHLRRQIEAGGEGELSEEDYQYALEQGLIEG